MFGMSFMELLIVAVLALVLLGPDQLPQAARKLGKGLRMLRDASDGLRSELSKLEAHDQGGDGAGAALGALRELQKLAEDTASLVRGEVLALTESPPVQQRGAPADGTPPEASVPATCPSSSAPLSKGPDTSPPAVEVPSLVAARPSSPAVDSLGEPPPDSSASSVPEEIARAAAVAQPRLEASPWAVEEAEHPPKAR